MESYGLLNLVLEARPVMPMDGSMIVTHTSFDLIVHLYGERRCIASRVLSNEDAALINQSPRKLMDLGVDLLRQGIGS